MGSAVTSVEPRARANRRELVMLGTGVSTGLPQISCVMAGAKRHCDVCLDGLRDTASPNRRCNVCALLRVGGRNVLIDCGKTMREAALRYFPPLGVRGVDAIVLTHGHADAMLGLDDLRDIQRGKATSLFLSSETNAVCRRVFPYLMPSNHGAAGQERGVSRRVATIDWHVVTEELAPFRPLTDVDVEFVPIPVLHGGDYLCWGFLINVGASDGEPACTIVYLSDVKEVPEKSMAFLKELDHIDLLIVDALNPVRKHPTHFSLEEATALARELRPDVTRCVGMDCKIGLHDECNKELLKLKETENLDIQLAHDGLRLPLSGCASHKATCSRGTHENSM